MKNWRKVVPGVERSICEGPKGEGSLCERFPEVLL